MQNSLIYHGGSRRRRAYSGVSDPGTFIEGIAQQVAYDDFGAAALQNSVILFFNKYPPGSILIGVRVKVDTVWTGAGITALYLSLGTLGQLGDIMDEYRADNITPGDTEYAESSLFQSYTYTGHPDIRMTARSEGANLDQLTQGTAIIEAWFLKKVLP